MKNQAICDKIDQLPGGVTHHSPKAREIGHMFHQLTTGEEVVATWGHLQNSGCDKLFAVHPYLELLLYRASAIGATRDCWPTWEQSLERYEQEQERRRAKRAAKTV